MSAHIQNTLPTLFQHLENLAERKNLCNVTIHCSNGVLHQNKLLLGLVFPSMELVEEFNRQPEVVLIIPDRTLQSITENIGQCLRRLFGYKAHPIRASDRKIEESSENELKEKSFSDNDDVDNSTTKTMIKGSSAEIDGEFSTEENRNVALEVQNTEIANCDIKEEPFAEKEENPDYSPTHMVQVFKFLCKTCGKCFKKESHAKYHCQLLFNCTVCEEEKLTKTEFKSHMKTEHGEEWRKGKSGYCGECNKTVGQLLAHTKRVHIQVKNHFCTFCERGFFDKRDMERHVSDRHEEKREVCPQCGLAVKRLHNHMSNFHKNRISPKVCPECGKAVHRMKDHLKSVHQL